MITVDNVTKYYGSHRALDSLSFGVKQGEILGFLGPNGAGKTTMMKILTNYINPTVGTVRIAGMDVEANSLEVRRLIGYLPENAPLYQDMIVGEYLQYITEIRKIPTSLRPRRTAQVLDVCGLIPVVGRPISQLSKGYRQRVGLAQALIHEPELLILDEPTSGLDPNQIVEIRDLIKEIGKEKTVILSTHILPEVEATCNRAVIINEGRIVADGALDELRRSDGASRIGLKIKTYGGEQEGPADFGIILKRIPGVEKVEAAGRDADGILGFTLSTSPDKDPRELIFRTAVERRWVLVELKREEMVLEDVFRRLTLAN